MLSDKQKNPSKKTTTLSLLLADSKDVFEKQQLIDVADSHFGDVKRPKFELLKCFGLWHKTFGKQIFLCVCCRNKMCFPLTQTNLMLLTMILTTIKIMCCQPSRKMQVRQEYRHFADLDRQRHDIHLSRMIDEVHWFQRSTGVFAMNGIATAIGAEKLMKFCLFWWAANAMRRGLAHQQRHELSRFFEKQISGMNLCHQKLVCFAVVQMDTERHKFDFFGDLRLISLTFSMPLDKISGSASEPVLDWISTWKCFVKWTNAHWIALLMFWIVVPSYCITKNCAWQLVISLFVFFNGWHTMWMNMFHVNLEFPHNVQALVRSTCGKKVLFRSPAISPSLHLRWMIKHEQNVPFCFVFTQNTINQTRQHNFWFRKRKDFFNLNLVDFSSSWSVAVSCWVNTFTQERKDNLLQNVTEVNSERKPMCFGWTSFWQCN